MARQITIVRSATEVLNVGDIQGYRYTVTAQNAVDMPNEIFRMFNRPLDPTIGTVVSEFNGICSPGDLVDLPINAPIPPEIRFRVAFIDLTFRDPSEGEAQWDSIKFETRELVRSLDDLDNLLIQETVTYGG